MTGSKHFNPFHIALQYSYPKNFFPLLPFNALYVTSLLPARSYLDYNRSGEQSTRKNSSTKNSKEAVLSVCVKNRPIYSSGEKKKKKAYFFGHLKCKCAKQIHTVGKKELHYMTGFFSISDFTKFIIRIVNYSFPFLKIK